jgi:hypothetical protein
MDRGVQGLPGQALWKSREATQECTPEQDPGRALAAQRGGEPQQGPAYILEWKLGAPKPCGSLPCRRLSLSFSFLSRPYLPKQTARASHPLHPRSRDRKQAVTATRPRLAADLGCRDSTRAARRCDWLSAEKRCSAAPMGGRAGGRGERGFTCLWYLLRGA